MNTASTPPLTPPPLPEKKKDWFSRNWKWFVPVIIVVPIVFMILFVGGILWGTMALIKVSEPYKEGLNRARENQVVIKHLGEPIEGGFFVWGNVHDGSGSGEADLGTTLSGPLGRGRLTIYGEKAAGEWDYYEMLVVLKDGTEINLLKKSEKLEE